LARLDQWVSIALVATTAEELPEAREGMRVLVEEPVTFDWVPILDHESLLQELVVEEAREESLAVPEGSSSRHQGQVAKAKAAEVELRLLEACLASTPGAEFFRLKARSESAAMAV
jgi:hypothetical protein